MIWNTEYGINQQWAELCVLRGIRHPHIIDFYADFFVLPKDGNVRQTLPLGGPESRARSRAADTRSKKLAPSAIRAKKSFFLVSFTL